jgi:very-short-patch-repair endonuclease
MERYPLSRGVDPESSGDGECNAQRIKANRKRLDIIPYDRSLKSLARAHRNESTLGEVLLWRALKSKRFHGYSFKRQKPLLKYIVDFYSKDLKLVIEVDGSYHKRLDVSRKDFEKKVALKSYGLTVMRFTEKQVRFEMMQVLAALDHYIHCYEDRSI